MFADTDAIRTFGAAYSTQAADLSALVTALTSLPAGSARSALGPVGAGFLAALADAATDASLAVAALGDRLEAADLTARASATAYENADHQLGGAISRL